MNSIYKNFQKQNSKLKSYKYDLASQYELEKFYEHLQDSMKMVGFVHTDNKSEFFIANSLKEAKKFANQAKKILGLSQKISMFHIALRKPDKLIFDFDIGNIRLIE